MLEVTVSTAAAIPATDGPARLRFAATLVRRNVVGGEVGSKKSPSFSSSVVRLAFLGLDLVVVANAGGGAANATGWAGRAALAFTTVDVDTLLEFTAMVCDVEGTGAPPDVTLMTGLITMTGCWLRLCKCLKPHAAQRGIANNDDAGAPHSPQAPTDEDIAVPRGADG